MRSLYMLSEYDNIKAERPMQHPEQFQGGAGTFIYHSLELQCPPVGIKWVFL